MRIFARKSGLARVLLTWAVFVGAAAASVHAKNESSLGSSPDSLSFRFPATGAPDARKALLLAIDERAFPLRNNLALFLTKPVVRSAPVLAPLAMPDVPDNVAVMIYGTVLHDEGRFRMWYYAEHATTLEGGAATSPICYAESTDGENWTRPNLGQVLYRGSRNNNCVALGDNSLEPVVGASVIRDDDDPRPERRYKMVYYGLRPRRLATAVSPDGIRWTDLPNPATAAFAELGSFYRHGDLYVVNTHIAGRGADDRQEGRQGYAWVSSDFEHWLLEVAPSFKAPEPVIGSGWGTHEEEGAKKGNYLQVHLGVGATSFGNVAVGVYGMWYQREPNWGEGGINGDFGLVVSQDGVHFDEVVKGQPYIRSDESPGDPAPGKNYPTILCQGNGILNVGDETLIYHGRWRNVEFQAGLVTVLPVAFVAKDYWGGIGLARLPRDRWGALALSGKEERGSAWTMPVTLAANCRLTINGAGLDGLRVDVADERFQPVAGFGQGQAGGSSGSAFDAEVGWTGRELRELAGKTVRFRIHFKRSATTNPQLFALNLLRKQ